MSSRLMVRGFFCLAFACSVSMALASSSPFSTSSLLLYSIASWFCSISSPLLRSAVFFFATPTTTVTLWWPFSGSALESVCVRSTGSPNRRGRHPLGLFLRLAPLLHPLPALLHQLLQVLLLLVNVEVLVVDIAADDVLDALPIDPIRRVGAL
ncbi:hypothetical protein TYRP_012088 [Tyrophagus putrescentiae]|nr:hypothetical protein TYRP_012088 [Tyrophagus putrescentiae]